MRSYTSRTPGFMVCATCLRAKDDRPDASCGSRTLARGTLKTDELEVHASALVIMQYEEHRTPRFGGRNGKN